MKKWICLLLCAVCLLSGCTVDDKAYVPTGGALVMDDGSLLGSQETEGKEEQELVMMYYPDISMNPFECTDFTNRTLFSLIYQGLFATDSNYQVTPILCGKYYVSESMKQYTFYLEKNAKFSDGTQVSIYDVYASYMAAMESPMYKGRFARVSEITVTQDGGLTVRLNTAFEDLQILMDIPIVKAEEVAADAPLGSGPYVLETLPYGKRLRRDRDWWCAGSADLVVTATNITLKEAESVNQIRDSFEFSDVGLVRSNPGSDSYADYRCDYELWDCENGEFLYLAWSANSEWYERTTFRKALTHAIDREMLVNDYYRGFAHAATLPASPQSPYYSSQLASKYGYDPEAFAEAVKKSGMTDATVRILVNKKDTLRLRVAREIKEMLEAGGVIVELMQYSGSTYQYFLRVWDYDLYIGKTQLSPNMDLSPFFTNWGSLRSGGMSDEVLAGFCQQALANRGNYYNLHEQVMEDARLVPILFSTYSVHATRGLLTGLSPSRDNVFYYSLDKDLLGSQTFDEPAPDETQPVETETMPPV